MWVQSLSQEDPLEKGHGHPLQYSSLKNPMDRGAWQAKGKWCKFFDIKSQFSFFL